MDKIRGNNAGLTWVGGCAIGCGVATVLLILAVILGAYGVKYGMEVGKEEVAAELSRQIQDARQKDLITPEEEAVFTEAVALSGRPESSPMAAFMLAQLFTKFQEAKGADRTAILEAAQDYNQFLRDHPAAGMRELFEFVHNHPKLRDVMDTSGLQHETDSPEDAPPDSR